MNFPAKFSVIKRYNLCLRSFLKHYLLSQCRSHYLCTVCHSFKHHTLLLHKEKRIFRQFGCEKYIARFMSRGTEFGAYRKKKNDSSLFLNEKISLATNCLFASNKSVILPSAIVMIQSHNGKFIESRTLLDSCSQINCISAEFAIKVVLV